MVVHVHGAHVGPGSDGYPEAWWLPAANDIPEGYATNGTFFESAEGADTAAALGQGYAIDMYPNDQPTTTLWYHDHSLGITRLNVYAAGAGFWLIRDANDGETGLISGVLPGPAPLAGQDPNGDPVLRAAIREIPIAIQPKSFNADGSQYYPADRAFFEGLGTGGTFADNTGVNIPFLPQASSDIAPVWNPEAFFNTMVVNGSTWPVYEVAPERYRLRMVNAADSRFLNLSLFQVNGQGAKLRELPFYQIGAEQSLLPQVVRLETGFATPLPGDGSDVNSKRPDCLLPNGKPVKNCVVRLAGRFPEQALILGPAERADVIVDFTGRDDGDMIVMFNTGPDAPFGGFPDVPADPATTGQVMMFRINAALANSGGDPSTPAPLLALDLNPGGVPKFDPAITGNLQDLALLEEESSLICVNVDPITGVVTQVDNSVPPDCAGGGAPFGPKEAVLGVNGSGGGTVQLWDDPILQNPGVNDIETWEMWNWSADGHPIHLHLVKFEVVNRQIIGGEVLPPEPWEAGWKDTVIAYPGEITRVKAKFDIPGLYVWHCHILSHEDNEMMVPYCVGQAGTDCPAELF
jgi:FtsP/CotA-like multicopper oxidase with cupredoxin domain